MRALTTSPAPPPTYWRAPAPASGPLQDRLPLVGVLLLIQENILQHVAGAGVAHAIGQLDVLLVPLDGLMLSAQVVLDHLPHVAAHFYLRDSRRGDAAVVVDALGQLLSVLHLIHRYLSKALVDLGAVEALGHDVVIDVLDDGRQLVRQVLIEGLDQLSRCLGHAPLLSFLEGAASSAPTGMMSAGFPAHPFIPACRQAGVPISVVSRASGARASSPAAPLLPALSGAQRSACAAP